MIFFSENLFLERQARIKETFFSIINAQKNDLTRECANLNADTPAGMMMKFSSETTKNFVSDYLLFQEVIDAMEKGYIHIHDQDYYPTKSLTCVHHPLDKMLKKGFKAGYAPLRPATDIESATLLACISLETAQNEMHGGQAIPAFDFYMAPYLKLTFIQELNKCGQYDNKNYAFLLDTPVAEYQIKDLDELSGIERTRQHICNQTVIRVRKAMDAFIENINTIHSRAGNQVAFTSINYGTDTSAEGRCIIRQILLSCYDGIGESGQTAIFPIHIWKKKRGVSYLPGDPNYDLYKLACKVSAKRFFPNFVNLDATFNYHESWHSDDPERYRYEVATMGCRTRVFDNRFGEKTSIGRGNLSFTTINIVRIALECIAIADKEERIRAFFLKLDNILDITALQLHTRYFLQQSALAKQFPLLMTELWVGSEKLKPNDTAGSIINQGTLGIGYIGLAECLIALTGKHHGESEEAQQLGLQIINHIREASVLFSQLYEHNYSVLATPAEGLAGKFTRLDKKDFGIIKDITDKDYYTNSNHVPVWYKCSISHKARVEGPYHALSLAGNIFYVEIDSDATHNPESIATVVDMMDKYNMGYCSVNHNRNRCLDCGYEDAARELKFCPHCGGSHIDTLQRITGYLVGTTDRWNSAKLAELHDRVVHN